MKTLIIKLGASGDVVRTTSLLHSFNNVDWITNRMNSILLRGVQNIERIICDDELESTKFDNYDLVINLEDNLESALILNSLNYKDLFGAYLNKDGKVIYTENSKSWFDLSLISCYGIEKANKLKYENNKSFQELIFSGLGLEFKADPYFLPHSPVTNLYGDIAIAPKAGKVWPMKNWAYFDELVEVLREKGLIVNYLPNRPTMLEHLTDVRNHKLLVCGDSLPMHLALGAKIKLITLFICTSPSEIYGYDRMRKIVSSELKKYWYRRDFEQAAAESIPLKTVVDEIELFL